MTDDFSAAKRGLIGSLEPCVVKDAEGRVVWDNDCCAALKFPMKAALAATMWRCFKAPQPGWLRGLCGAGAGGRGTGAGG